MIFCEWIKRFNYVNILQIATLFHDYRQHMKIYQCLRSQKPVLSLKVKWSNVTLGDFQLEFVSISQVINHLTCYKSSALIGWNYSIQTRDKRGSLLGNEEIHLGGDSPIFEIIYRNLEQRSIFAKKSTHFYVRINIWVK